MINAWTSYAGKNIFIPYVPNRRRQWTAGLSWRYEIFIDTPSLLGRFVWRVAPSSIPLSGNKHATGQSACSHLGNLGAGNVLVAMET